MTIGVNSINNNPKPTKQEWEIGKYAIKASIAKYGENIFAPKKEKNDIKIVTPKIEKAWTKRKYEVKKTIENCNSEVFNYFAQNRNDNKKSNEAAKVNTVVRKLETKIDYKYYNDKEYKDLEQEIFNLINEEREKSGLDALTWDYDIEAATDLRADEIVDNFSHDRVINNKKSGKKEMLAFYTADPTGNYSGENLAYGYNDAKELVQAWIDSPTHRANLKDENFTRGSVSVSKSSEGTLYITSGFGYEGKHK